MPAVRQLKRQSFQPFRILAPLCALALHACSVGVLQFKGSSAVQQVSATTNGTASSSTSLTQGWLGGVAATGGWQGAGTPAPGRADGQLSNPANAASDGTYLYVADSSNHRIVRIELSSGNIAGWIGAVGATPTGGASGCAGLLAASSSVTPGWCFGGASTSSSAAGGLSFPYAVAVDTINGVLLVSDTGNYRVSKYALGTGSYQGSLGYVSSSGGNCMGAAYNGWCSGGFFTYTSGPNGGFNTAGPRGIAVSGSLLFVVDNASHRVNQYALSTGAYNGSIGNVSTSGGTCAALGFPSSGFCSGGTFSSSGTGGGMNAPNGISTDGVSLYVADTGNSRINKYSIAGIYQGSIGYTSSSGGTCTAGIQSSFCSGGVFAANAQLGGFSSPEGVYYDPTAANLYVADTSNYRVQSFNSAGSSAMEIGYLTGGAGGCVNGVQSGWCSGTGVAGSSNALGGFSLPRGVTIASGSLYVSDSAAGRIQRFSQSSGAVAGQWGGLSAPAPGWMTSGVPMDSVAGTALQGDGAFLAGGVALDTLNGFLYVSDTNSHRILKFKLGTGAFVGWIGKVGSMPTGGAAGCSTAAVGTATPGWCLGGGSSGGEGDGFFLSPTRIALDTQHDFLYVTDTGANRINRIQASTGQYQGSLWRVSSNAGTCVANVFNAWCTGGTADSSGNYNDGTLNSPTGIALNVAADRLYVADTGAHRVFRYKLSTGAFLGSLGKINTSTSCGSGAYFSGWCTDTTATHMSGAGSGDFNGPASLALSSGILYVSDFSNHRVSKYDESTGQYLGSIGNVSTTGGTCSTAGPGGGWCMGALAWASGVSDGAFNNPTGLSVDNVNGLLYVGETGNRRMQRFDLNSGSPRGWRGQINAPPSGGDSFCASSIIGQFTPGWCLGGSAVISSYTTLGFDPGLMVQPTAMEFDPNSRTLYIADHFYSRVLRLPQ